MESFLVITGLIGLIIGLSNPKVFSKILGENANRPILILLFGSIMILGAFWNEKNSNGAIGLICLVALIIGLVNPSVFKPILKNFATRPIITIIFLGGFILAVALEETYKNTNETISPNEFSIKNDTKDPLQQTLSQLQADITNSRKLLVEKKYTQALNEAELYLQRYEVENSPELKAEALRLKADALYHNSNLDAALAAYELALNIYKNLQYWEQEAWCYYYLGFIHYYQNDFKAAINQFILAENIYQTHDQPYNLALTKAKLGDCYRLDNQHNKAINYYRSARELFTKLNNLDNIAWINCYWAESLDKLGKVDEAINKITAALDYYKTQSNDGYTAWCFERLADYKLKQGDKANAINNYTLAIDYYNKARDLNKVKTIGAKIKEIK